MLMADNYNKKGEPEKAIQIYQHASNMVPCRFLPLYQIFDIYRKTGQTNMAVKYSTEIINKKVKIPSLAIDSIKSEAEEYLMENKSGFNGKTQTELGATEAAPIYCATSRAYATYQYWHKNYKKWYFALHYPEILKEYNDARLNNLSLQNYFVYILQLIYFGH